MIYNGTTIQDTSRNFYQDNFQKLIATGTSISEAITVVTHRYLDNKPVKLSQNERDSLFWSSLFWAEVSNDVFETEVFALALARYLKPDQVTQNALLQRVASGNPHALQRAIRYSQVFLFPHEKCWKHIKKLFTRNDNFSTFFNACKVIEKEYRQFKNKIRVIETELKHLSLLEILMYSGCYAFKNDIVLAHGEHLLLLHVKDVYPAAWFQKVTDALNQILWAKLRTCSNRQFHLTEPILGKSLGDHMLPLLFPTPATVQASKKIKHHLAVFEQLVEAYIQFNHFVKPHPLRNRQFLIPFN